VAASGIEWHRLDGIPDEFSTENRTSWPVLLSRLPLETYLYVQLHHTLDLGVAKVASLRHFNCMPLGTFRCRQARSEGTRHPMAQWAEHIYGKENPGTILLVR
jgi:hypothetical protein